MIDTGTYTSFDKRLLNLKKENAVVIFNRFLKDTYGINTTTTFKQKNNLFLLSLAFETDIDTTTKDCLINKIC